MTVIDNQPGTEASTGTSWAAVRDRYADVLTRIGDSAAQRDAQRTLPYEDVSELARLGFGALRVPRSFGGAGLNVSDFIEALLDLGTADSNIVQALRSHFLYTESLVLAPESDARSAWLRRIAAGDLIGGGATERDAPNSTHFATTLTRNADGQPVLNGRKYYSTGTLYADWFATIAEDENGGVARAIVSTAAAGIERVDDWDGFGQQLTASGSTALTDVVVDEALRFPDGAELDSYATSFAQEFHLVALAGIARAAHREVVDYVKNRTRYFAHGPRVFPRHDPIVQEVLGELSSASFVAETLVRRVGSELDDLAEAPTTGRLTPESEDRVELDVYRAQYTITTTVLGAVTRLFDVGGATALSKERGWDRFWRNARTLASHNPIGYRLTSIGEYELNGTSPFRQWFSGVDLRERVRQDGA